MNILNTQPVGNSMWANKYYITENCNKCKKEIKGTVFSCLLCNNMFCYKHIMKCTRCNQIFCGKCHPSRQWKTGSKDVYYGRDGTYTKRKMYCRYCKDQIGSSCVVC